MPTYDLNKLGRLQEEYNQLKNKPKKTDEDRRRINFLYQMILQEQIELFSAMGSEPKKNVSSKMDKKSKVILIAVAVFVFLVIGLPLISCYESYRDGIAALNSGKYIEAVEFLRKGNIFAKKEEMNLAYCGAGDVYMDEGNFWKAYESYCKAGEDAFDLQVNCICTWAIEYCDTDKLNYLKDYRAEAQKNEARLAIARKEMEKDPLSLESLETASNTLSEITDPTTPGLKAFSSQLNYQYGMYYLNNAFPEEVPYGLTYQDRKQSVSNAVSHFSLCKSEPNVQKIINVFEEYDRGNYLDSAKIFCEIFQNQQHLLDQFTLYIAEKTLSGSVTDRLNARAGWSYLSSNTAFCDETDKGLINCMKDKWLKRNMYEHTVDSAQAIVVKSRKDILSQCGSKPNGKILIITENVGFSVTDPQKYCAIDLEAMAYLPEKYFPTSLEEVEYVIVLEFNHKIDGSYWGARSARGIQENAVLTVYQLPKNRKLYTSGKKTGPHSPFTVTVYNGDYHPCYSGGKPDILQYASKGFKKIIAAEAKQK